MEHAREEGHLQMELQEQLGYPGWICTAAIYMLLFLLAHLLMESTDERGYPKMQPDKRLV